MNHIARAASTIGVTWAEHRFTRLGLRGGHIPKEWPGTVEEAAELVSFDELYPTDRARLALAVNRIARETWRELVW